jgi:putative transposase
MELYKSRVKNIFHYVTTVTFNRARIFDDDASCHIFIDCLAELRLIHPFKLLAYVIMPDHIHMILNPMECDISLIMRKLKGKSAKLILDLLRSDNRQFLLKTLELKSRGRQHAVWLKDFSSIDLWSHKFVMQKLNYIHMNPVRAGLCDHPSNWKWSSYRAYHPHEAGSVPIEIDWQAYWGDSVAGKPASKQ